ncbi:MAG: iron-sulfur cluster assembly scaffold protein [Promethearchaeota archaeon Loki_b32]|nr:MAG: iron-sulfur cluster assembly scaffold protein [Candidatus Lokiarchaeota archaeon Loki_b32]
MSPDNLDKWVEEIQKEIIDEEIKRYNKYIVELLLNPKNWGKPKDDEISVLHAYEGSCGDTMQFFLKINEGIIEKANFITDGCGATVAAGSQTTMMVEGHTLEFAERLRPIDVENALGGLPDDHKHCAELAMRTLHRAIEKYKIQSS